MLWIECVYNPRFNDLIMGSVLDRPVSRIDWRRKKRGSLSIPYPLTLNFLQRVFYDFARNDICSARHGRDIMML